ncbi:MAG: GNAT family N-acetyltransferase [Methanobrevibacter sp.]|uniref:GNAT family N-acetyltransferase n=1 Tax=Methanobrevibacter millerae TaxID=230361 RepID=A0A8T3VRU7_9EURY|nr:GNAT family N-acetyltransferase [Methanobrevibacter sp.]MBE6510675.1 GNAT family N-acetyltransferase [Methanobrevibacter millerae]MBO5151163.1 GNAT family N-acetyltransferase [Methanobrevibacter sp.]
MNVIIKELTNDSNLIKDVQDFLFKQIKKEFGYDYVPKWHQDIVNMESFYINPKRNNFFVAFNGQNNEIIATIGIRSYDKNFLIFQDKYSSETTSSIWRLFVDERYRRCGLASKMFSVAENFANESDYDEIYLHTHRTLDGALKFWTKMGFVITIDEGDELQTVHMDKKIRGVDITPVQSSFTYAVEL